MNWSKFIVYLLEQELKISSTEAERLTGIRQPVFDRWKNNKISRPHRATIRKLEAALGIIIDDSDPDNIIYKTKTSPNPVNTTRTNISSPVANAVTEFNNSTFFKEFALPLAASLPAGLGEFSEINSGTIITLDSRRQFAIEVSRENGDSMQPFLKPGDIVVCDTAAVPITGDMVAARWSNEHAAIKILGDSSLVPGSYLLYSYNPAIKPIIVSRESTRLYKIVLVSKQSL